MVGNLIRSKYRKRASENRNYTRIFQKRRVVQGMESKRPYPKVEIEDDDYMEGIYACDLCPHLRHSSVRSGAVINLANK